MKYFTLFFAFVPFLFNAQTHTEKISKTFSFEKKSPANAVLIFNISGDVKVESYNGDQIVVEIEKIIEAKTNERLEAGKKEIQLGVLDIADSLIFYVAGTGQEFGNKRNIKLGNKVYSRSGYGYYDQDGNRNHNSHLYDYTMNMKIKVPSSIHVKASTINNGDVVVSGVQGRVEANNVNGSIDLKNISESTYAHTINGTVHVDYTKNPTGECSYYSLNGDVTVLFPSPVNGTMSFKSFNGDLFTNIDALDNMAPSVTKKDTDKGTKYKIASRFKIRSGSGPHLNVETFNGDAIIKENIKQ